jgi:hypothetical protein
MPPTAVRTRIPQPLDIIQDLSTQVILNLHFGQCGCDVEDLLVL